MVSEDETRMKAKILKRILIMASSEIGDIRDKHQFVKDADRLIMQAASKLEGYLRATE